MIERKEDNIRSESYYPDSNYYLDQNNTQKETPLSEDQLSNTSKFEWPTATGLSLKEQMEDSQ